MATFEPEVFEQRCLQCERPSVFVWGRPPGPAPFQITYAVSTPRGEYEVCSVACQAAYYRRSLAGAAPMPTMHHIRLAEVPLG